MKNPIKSVKTTLAEFFKIENPNKTDLISFGFNLNDLNMGDIESLLVQLELAKRTLLEIYEEFGK